MSQIVWPNYFLCADLHISWTNIVAHNLAQINYVNNCAQLIYLRTLSHLSHTYPHFFCAHTYRIFYLLAQK